jgi:hypothetical protein
VVTLKLLVEERLVELLVKLELNLGVEQSFPQLDLSKLLLQLTSER